MYPVLRTIHLLCGVFALPMLLMYAVSAVQMAHSKWFPMKPAVTEHRVALSENYQDGRRLARDVMAAQNLRGEIASIQTLPAGFLIRVIVPGTVHEIRYDRTANSASLKTSVAGFMGMLNRLHHAAGLWHEYGPLKLWAVLVAIVSVATIGLAVTGLWMWWLRRQERFWGLILLGGNLAFAIVVLTMIRSSGP